MSHVALSSDAPQLGPAGLPRPVMRLVVALAVSVVALAAVARHTGLGHVAPPASVPLASRALVFHDRGDGAVPVRDVDAGRDVATLGPGEGMFVRSTVRALARGRRLRGADAGVPFRLTRWRDGRTTLDDPVTRTHVELSAFGPTNAAAFDVLLR